MKFNFLARHVCLEFLFDKNWYYESYSVGFFILIFDALRNVFSLFAKFKKKISIERPLTPSVPAYSHSFTDFFLFLRDFVVAIFFVFIFFMKKFYDLFTLKFDFSPFNF